MSTQKYHGWTNYATWRANLEIIDDYVSSLVPVDPADKWDSAADLADHLEDYADDVLTGFGATEEGLAIDYARAFVSDVDWYEIAATHADELVRSARDEEEEDDDCGC